MYIVPRSRVLLFCYKFIFLWCKSLAIFIVKMKICYHEEIRFKPTLYICSILHLLYKLSKYHTTYLEVKAQRSYFMSRSGRGEKGKTGRKKAFTFPSTPLPLSFLLSLTVLGETELYGRLIFSLIQSDKTITRT